MNTADYIGHQAGRFVKFLDRAVNVCIGWCDAIWSSFGGKKNETISLSMGAEEGKELVILYRKIGDKVYDLNDIVISPDHILGEPTSDFCDKWEPYHALKCLNRNWKSRSAKELLRDYPEAKLIVPKFLKRKKAI